MSFYDDASLVLLAGGAAGKDGKVYNIKPISPAKDFTFDRGTDLTATRVGKDGYIEKGRENLLLQSNTFSTTWTTSSASVTSGESGYDGTNNAWLLTATSAFNRVQQSISVSGAKRFSVYAKANTNDYLLLGSFEGAHWYATFNLATGAVDSNNVNAISPSIEDVGGGWYRCSATWIGTTTEVRIGTQNASGQSAWATTTSGSIYIQDAQLEQGLVATDYIETGATTATAGLLEDEPRFDYTGGGCPALLIEKDSTNLIENTEYFNASSWTRQSSVTITDNATTSPSGSNDASKYNIAGPVNRAVIQNTTLTNSETYTFSMWVKAIVDTDIRVTSDGGDWSEDISLLVSDGWKRIESTHTMGATESAIEFLDVSGLTGDRFYIWGAQLEADSYATSYIPNHGAAATASRSFDNPNELTHGITMGTSCSIFLEATNFKVTETGGAQTSLLKMRAATSPSENDRFLFLGSDNTASTFTLKAQNKESGTPATKTLIKTGVTMGSPFKALARYDGTSFDLFVNGVLEDSETIVADDHFGRVDLKNLTVQGQNGHSISQVILFDSALSNAECIELTTL